MTDDQHSKIDLTDFEFAYPCRQLGCSTPATYMAWISHSNFGCDISVHMCELHRNAVRGIWLALASTGHTYTCTECEDEIAFAERSLKSTESFFRSIRL